MASFQLLMKWLTQARIISEDKFLQEVLVENFYIVARMLQMITIYLVS